MPGIPREHTTNTTEISTSRAIVSVREGREDHHHLNIQTWIDSASNNLIQRKLSGLAQYPNNVEKTTNTTTNNDNSFLPPRSDAEHGHLVHVNQRFKG
jgi:hypothetical protein